MYRNVVKPPLAHLAAPTPSSAARQTSPCTAWCGPRSSTSSSSATAKRATCSRVKLTPRCSPVLLLQLLFLLPVAPLLALMPLPRRMLLPTRRMRAPTCGLCRACLLLARQRRRCAPGPSISVWASFTTTSPRYVHRSAGLLRLASVTLLAAPPPSRQRLSVAADSYKTALRRPVPIDVRALLASAGGDVEGGDGSASAGVLAEQRVLTPAGSLRLFVDTLVRMCVILLRPLVSCLRYPTACHRFTCPETRTAVGSLEFTKDSPADVDFVTGATNLRAHTFGIPVRRAC